MRTPNTLRQIELYLPLQLTKCYEAEQAEIAAARSLLSTEPTSRQGTQRHDRQQCGSLLCLQQGRMLKISDGVAREHALTNKCRARRDVRVSQI